MLDVAIRASGGERLLRTMDRAIVTSQAGVIVGVPLKASLREVTGVAFGADQRVCPCERPGIVMPWISCRSLPSEARNHRDRENHR